MPAGLRRRNYTLIKIFRYECRRLLWNKFFIGFLLILLLYGWQVLNNITILGVSHTAPFSPWSFGDYLSRMLPLLRIGVLFFLTFFISNKAKRCAVLTDATAISPQIYTLLRSAAALTATLFLVFCSIGEAIIFYSHYFQWYAWGSLLLPIMVTLLPALIFALGSGWLLGGFQPWLLYVWMLFPFILAMLPLPEAFSIWNGSFFRDFPLSMEILDPDFTLPATVMITQVALLIIGIIFTAAANKIPQHTK